MMVEVICIAGHEYGSEIILSVETITEVSNNVGTFINIIQENGVVTSLWKKYVDRLEVTE